jgi:STE24 endopeptidase
LPAVVLVGLAFWFVDKIIGLPFGIARWLLETDWGMSRQSLGEWLADYRLSLILDLATSLVIVIGLFLLLRWFPRRWWLVAWLGGTALGVVYVLVLPVVIEPLYNTFTPLSQTQWRDQEAKLRQLVAKAEVEIGDILVVDASRRGSHTNAYFTGFGPTRRIVMYDNLLKKHSSAEVESILAHELGHWLHHHIVVGLVLGSAGLLLGLFLTAQLLRWAARRPPLELRSPSDPASIPFLLLLVWLGGWLALPLENGVSRHFERQADAMSLKLAGQPDVFIEAEKRLARDNLSNVVPHPVAVLLYYTHPPAVERIRMAEEWRARRLAVDTMTTNPAEAAQWRRTVDRRN